MNRISYRQLQSCAKAMKLPGNMKYQVLWDMVSARKAGNERRVGQLMAEQKRLRFERRMNRKVARTLEDNNLRLAQLSSAVYNNSSTTTNTTADNHNNNNDSNRLSSTPILVDGSTTQEIVIDTSGEIVPQASDPPHIEWDYSKDLKMVHLLDAKLRHDVMAREIAEYRKAIQLLPFYKPNEPHNVLSHHYQFAPVTPSSVPYVPNCEPLVPLSRPVSIQGASGGPSMSQMIGGPNYEYKETGESCGRQVRCYQIEDLMGPVPSTSSAPGYPNGQYPSGPYYNPVVEDHFARYKMFDHEGYHQKHSGLPDHDMKSQMNDDPYGAGVGVSPNSDTVSADELDMEMTLEDEQYAGFEPYIEEVISSQPFEPEHSLAPSHIFKSEEPAVENLETTEDSNEKIIVEIGAEKANQIGAEKANQSSSISVKKERIDSINQDENNDEVEPEGGNTVDNPEGGNTVETDAPGALLTSSEQRPTADTPPPDMDDDKDTSDGELEIVVPEYADDNPAEDSKLGLLINFRDVSNAT